MKLLRRTAPRNEGFTLIELLLSLAIFTLIGLATVKQIQQIMVTKNSAFEDLDMYNDVRAALSLMRNDLSQAFHVPLADMDKSVKQALQRNEAVAHTAFDGRAKEMVFTSLSHRNFYANRRESEQTEISYFLYNSERSSLPSLMKRESEVMDADLFQGGPLYRLLDNVSELEFSYWDERQERWVSDWNSDSGNYFDKFPLQVKVRITVQPVGRQAFTVESVMKVAFPNNSPQLVQF